MAFQSQAIQLIGRPVRIPANLILAMALILSVVVYITGVRQAEQSRKFAPPEQMRIALPPELQVFMALGDRYLAANLEVFRALVLSIEKTDPDSLKVLAEVQKGASKLNPAHEDNYYIGQAILPWVGYVEQTQFIVSRATDSRPWDFLPGFFYAFNRYYFENRPQEASNILLGVVDRLPSKEGVLELAAKWQEKGEDPHAALAVIRAMQRDTRDAKLKRILQMRIDRLEGLVVIREAADRYEKRTGKRLSDLHELLKTGDLKEAPQDPTGLGYALNEKGQPVLYFPPKKPIGKR